MSRHRLCIGGLAAVAKLDFATGINGKVAQKPVNHRGEPSGGGRWAVNFAATGLIVMSLCGAVSAGEQIEAGTSAPTATGDFLNVREMLAAGGAIGYVIMFLSFVMVAMIVDYFMQIRRRAFMPPGLAEEVHRYLGERKIADAVKICDAHPSFLGKVLRSGLDELSGGYAAVEKALEDSAAEQSARAFRRIEHLSVISTLAPMLGLMGTVWGMILAFMEFETKANPQISELAPGVYKALITTLQGLGVAIPAIAALAWFRSRVEELSTEATLLAAHVFADFRRAGQARRKSAADSGSG